MDLLKAIYQRRAVRHYSDAAVTRGMVFDLLQAAVQAPSSLNQQPWAFAVVHGRERLAAYSDRAKAHLLSTCEASLSFDPFVDEYASSAVNLFHGTDTLVVICAKPGRFHPTEDCFLAAQNLMLAAHGLGLGSCPVGFARPWFNLPEVKAELGIPSHYAPVLPLVIGHPAHPPAAVPRREAETVGWLWDEG
jgi:nitroreductase